MASRGYAVSAVLVALTALVAVGGQWLLPGFFERLVAAEMSRMVKAKTVDVEVMTVPPYRLLSGAFDTLRIDIRGARFGELAVSGFFIDARGLDVDVRELLGRRKFVISKVDRLQSTLMLTEGDLSDYFSRAVTKGRVSSVRLVDGKAIVAGSIPFFNTNLNITLIGSFAIEKPTTIRFVPEELTVERTLLPKFLLNNFIVKEAFAIPIRVEDLPVPLEITDIRVERGRLFMFARKAEASEVAPEAAPEARPDTAP